MKCAEGWRRPGAAAVLPLLLTFDLTRWTAAQLNVAFAPSPALAMAPSPQQVPLGNIPRSLPLPSSATGPSLMVGPPPRGTVTMRSLRLSENAQSQSASIYIGANSEFTMGTDPAGNFMIQKANTDRPLMALDTSNVLHLNTAGVQAISVDVASHFALRGVRQWELVTSEDFTNMGAGWTRTEVSNCAGISMLGGYCKFSHGQVNKTFGGLPPHSHLRIKATYHFIDRWIGESGYMKLNIGMDSSPVTVWSEQHAQEQSKNGISICGQGDTPEGKFAVPIDVTVPHTTEGVQITFGSTMSDSDPCDESWGVSGVELYTRQ